VEEIGRPETTGEEAPERPPRESSVRRIRPALEALLFSSSRPVRDAELAESLEAEPAAVAAALASLAEEADVFFCEARFLDRDADRAKSTHHLTARQAGWLARRANVKRLEVFHFSPRYEREPEALHQEAVQAFQGEEVHPEMLWK